MQEKPVVFGVLDGGEPFGQPALIEQDLTIDAWQDATVQTVWHWTPGTIEEWISEVRPGMRHSTSQALWPSGSYRRQLHWMRIGDTRPGARREYENRVNARASG
ncbi:hypothetical protein [Streptomyces sp. NBC_01483]|uniref:hypothetical protein n=1 Tax=Streptomyces sp. NBC_01483 TaxID=2903883 RepID=UPI002E35343D|nr:hypothetical protein [Streptomyces sp. NBC_01483]